MKTWRRMLLSACMIFTLTHADAQIQQLSIGVNGLTCSQCSRSVYNALVKLSFVQKVEMDLNETIAHITFKKGAEPDFEAMAGAVVKAGYKVRDMHVRYEKRDRDKNNLVLFNSYCIALNQSLPSDQGIVRFTLIGNEFNAEKAENEKLEEIAQTVPKPSGCKKIYFGILK